MTYKSIVFWGGLIVLDSLLFLGLPEGNEHTAMQQPRLEPVHCWEDVDDGRQIAVSSERDRSKSGCPALSNDTKPIDSTQPQMGIQSRSVVPNRNARVRVNISIYPVI